MIGGFTEVSKGNVYRVVYGDVVDENGDWWLGVYSNLEDKQPCELLGDKAIIVSKGEVEGEWEYFGNCYYILHDKGWSCYSRAGSSPPFVDGVYLESML